MRTLLAATLLLVATRAFADDDLTGLDDRTQQLARSLNANARPHFVLGYKAFDAKDNKTANTKNENTKHHKPKNPKQNTKTQTKHHNNNNKHTDEHKQKYL